MKVLATILCLIIIVIGGTVAFIIFVPSPDSVVEAYIEAWEEGDYQRVYALLTEESQKEISEDQLRAAYEEFFNEAGITTRSIDNVSETEINMRSSKISFTAKYSSKFFNDQTTGYEMMVVRQGLLGWKIVWNHDLVFPGLKREERLICTRTVPVRGEIYDRNGEALAVNGQAVVIGIEPRRVVDQQLLVERLEELLGVDPEWVISQYTAPSVQPDWFVPIRKISRIEYDRLEPELRPIPGVVFRTINARIYPQGEVAAHITGYIGEVSGEWISSFPEEDYRSGDIGGRTGLERAFEKQLRGQLGYTLIAENNDGARRVIMDKPAVRGDDIYLTLDMTLQWAAWEALDNKEGAFVVIDPISSELLVLVSTPGYDPNRFTLGMTTFEWASLRDDTRQPMFNRALSGRYPPGSIFKVVSASVALDTGIVTPDTLFEDNGTYMVRGNIIRNFENHVYGEHTFKDALVNSINTTFAKIGLELGSDVFAEYCTRYGFDQKSKLPLPVEVSQIGDLKVSLIDLARSSVGQARVYVTPFQMARVISVVAADGKSLEPSMVYRIVRYDDKGRTTEEYQRPEDDGVEVIKPETASQLTALLVDVVEEGTGVNARLSGIPIAGKTGTSEIMRGSDDTHAWFIGFAPANDPYMAFSVFVEKGGVGGQVAAPIAREFLEKVFDIR